MVSTLTKKQLRVIAENTPENLIGSQPRKLDTLGLFMPAGANWAYRACYTDRGQLVVTRFGIVCGPRDI